MRTTTLIALVTLVACRGATAESGTQPAPAATIEVPQAPGTRVEVAKLQPSDATLDVRLPGEVTGSRDATLGAANGGYVEAVLVRRGDSVRKGQVVARVDTATHSALRIQALAQLEQAEADLARVTAMGDLASGAQLQAATTQVTVAVAAMTVAKTRSYRASVTAPFSGVIGQVAVEVGEVLAPGAPVARLVQLDPVHVTVSISDRDIGSVGQGMPVRITTDAMSGVFEGQVVALDPVADLSTRSFLGEIEVPNPDHALLPGMIATAALSGPIGSSGVVIPQSWLVTRRTGVGVFLLEDGLARWRPVVPGTVVYDQVLISEGLTEGDLVVSTGHRGLADGDPLIVTREGQCCVDGRATF
jgi:RND family efflux transporter MFP subunit